MRRTLIVLALLAAGCGGASATDDNGVACDSYRGHVSSTGSTFEDLGKGTITPADALPVIKKAQDGLSTDASIAHGDLQPKIQTVADALGRLRVALANGSDLTAETKPVLDSIDPVDAACKAIKH